MTLQTSINLYSIPGQPGQIASLSLFSIYQAIPGWTAGGVIPFGRLVHIDSSDNKIKLPSATGQTIIGATVFDMAHNAAYLDSGTVDGIPDGGLASIMTKGDIWVSCESATAAPGDKVYVRHTADGAKTTLGGVADSAGTGLDLVADAIFLTPTSNGLAVIKLNK